MSTNKKTLKRKRNAAYNIGHRLSFILVSKNVFIIKRNDIGILDIFS